MNNSGKPQFYEIGRRLAEVRFKSQLNQTQMAKRLGVSLKAYSNYEVGLREPPASLIFDMSSQFSVDPAWLYQGAGVGPGLGDVGHSTALWSEVLIAVERQLTARSVTVSPEQKAKIVQAVTSHLALGGKNK